MNRIIIVGNGFDRAHNLPTLYSDFLDHLRDSIARYEKDERDHISRLIVNNKPSRRSSSNFVPRKTEEGTDKWICAKRLPQKNEFELATQENSESIYFKSLFQKKKELGEWSNLESHYFKLLCKNREAVDKIKLINEEFEHLKQLISSYLKEQIEGKTGKGNKYNIDAKNSIYSMLRSRDSSQFKKNYFVTFNYTSKILNQYFFWLRDTSSKSKFPIEPIHIHGDLHPTNPIIFGYGDESSDEYKVLERIGNNKLLKNFKTFQYLRSSKYNQVLGLLEDSEKIYVQIIGHSCGLCDKALLRTIFQHTNVKHIEPVYHDNESQYFENLYNISRIFDDNTLMREKIVSLDETFKI